MVVIELVINTLFGKISCHQVLPRENGVRYPWNFICQKCFWKTANVNNYHNSSPEVHIRDKVSQKAMFSGKENAKAAVEAITFDMKQQELDHRYGC